MQYTASSFGDLLVGLFGWALRPEKAAPQLRGPFPTEAEFKSHVPDTVLDRGILPLFRFAERAFSRLHLLQRGNVHVYLLYIIGTLLVLLLWT
jgi:hypothetical protein